MTPRIALPSALAAQVLAEARAAYPRECCGLLEGLRQDDCLQVLALHPVCNLAPDADRFEMNAQDQFAAQKAARANGRTIIGCYHSHPDGKAQPSAADLAGAGEEGFLWLIAADEMLAAHLYSDGVFVGVVMGADFVTSSV